MEVKVEKKMATTEKSQRWAAKKGPIQWKNIDPATPSDAQNNQIVHWWVLGHSGPSVL